MLDSGTEQYLTVEDAARLYAVSRATLLQRLRAAEIDGLKVRGRRGLEWRVGSKQLEAFGYRRREATAPTVAELQRTIRRLQETVSQHCRRADELDSRLGGRTMENARLRAELEALQQRLGPPSMPSPRRSIDLTEAPQHTA